MIVSIMQPAYLPWLGYFHRIAISDLHIVLDHVQIDKNSKTKFANRNKVRTKEGWSWLTVPTKTKGRYGRLHINQLEIAGGNSWEAKHWSTIRLNYGKAAHFAEHAAFFETIYYHHWERLVDLTSDITDYLLKAFGIATPLLKSSNMGLEGKKSDLLLNLCRSVGASVYVSGPLGRDYLDERLFEEAGLKIAYHDYRHPSYPQAYPGFEAYMSAIDLLFNCGEKSLEILMGNQRSRKYADSRRSCSS